MREFTRAIAHAYRCRVVLSSALIGLALAACTGASTTGDADGSPTSAPTSSSAPAAPTPVESREVTPREALAVSEDYFDAHDRGDVRAMLELFTRDVELSLFEPVSTGDWWRLLTWQVAQGTELIDPRCETSSVAPNDRMTVTCEYGHRDRPAQVVDGSAVPFTVKMVVTPDGISRADFTFGEPDFSVVGDPFGAWMIANYPDDADKVRCCEWASVNEARAYGQLTARYAHEWADHLEEHSCTYDEPCPTRK